MFLKILNSNFSFIEVWFTHEYSNSLVIEDRKSLNLITVTTKGWCIVTLNIFTRIKGVHTKDHKKPW